MVYSDLQNDFVRIILLFRSAEVVQVVLHETQDDPEASPLRVTDMIAPIQLVRRRASRAPQPQAKPVQLPRFGKEQCEALAKKYHPHDAVVRAAVDEYSPERFLRLFLTAHGMPPAGTWQTHTYARITDS